MGHLLYPTKKVPAFKLYMHLFHPNLNIQLTVFRNVIDTKKRSLQMMHVCLLVDIVEIFSVVILLDIIGVSVSTFVGPV